MVCNKSQYNVVKSLMVSCVAVASQNARQIIVVISRALTTIILFYSCTWMICLLHSETFTRSMILQVYADLDLAGDVDSRISNTTYVYTLGGWCNNELGLQL